MEDQVTVKPNDIGEELHNRLGPVYLTWVQKQTRSSKFLLAAVGVIGALFVFTIFYGPKLLPWLKSVATWLQYLAILALTPLFKYIGSMGKDQMWSLHENGYLVRLTHEGKILQQKMGLWKHYSSCTYDKTGVRLIPKVGLRKSVRVPCTANRMEVYSICRERISMANALSLASKIKAPEKPKSKEHRRLEKMQKWNKWMEEASKEQPKSNAPRQQVFNLFGPEPK